MLDKIVVSKIVIKMGKKDVELSLEEAKELQEILNNTLGKVVYIPSAPIYIDHPYRWTTPRWEVSWTNSTNNTGILNFKNVPA